MIRPMAKPVRLSHLNEFAHPPHSNWRHQVQPAVPASSGRFRRGTHAENRSTHAQRSLLSFASVVAVLSPRANRESGSQRSRGNPTDISPRRCATFHHLGRGSPHVGSSGARDLVPPSSETVFASLGYLGLRAHEVARLWMMFDWKRERFKVLARKAGHATAYPLAGVVAEAIIDSLKQGRPTIEDRHLFLRIYAPQAPITSAAVSSSVALYSVAGSTAPSRAMRVAKAPQLRPRSSLILFISSTDGKPICGSWR
jgi:hypothetical protein